MASGMVYLVGAGPGDLGLVTLRARELIGSADVLVYDYLVHPEMLAWCRADCETIYVGKRPHWHAVPQDDIEKLLVEKARAGKNVVRLKGGDPLVFGRGGEEARHLAADKIPFEIVPGVTAALAAGAYAGIPLTQRSTSSALIFLTGHEDTQKHEQPIDWRSYGALKNATLAIYMGMGHLRHILDELMAGGLAAETPAAAVQWASRGCQRSVTGTAATLAGLVENEQLGAPAIVFVGGVVRDHAATDWFERLPLFGRRIAVTRAREQTSALRARLELLGAEVLELPLIRVSKKVDRAVRDDVFAGLGSYDWLVFTSANGVRFFFEEFFEKFSDVRSLGFIRIASVGETTSSMLTSLRLCADLIPATATSAALADELVATGSLDSAKVLVVTGNLNRHTLVKRLEAARAIVDTLAVYQTEKADLSIDPAAADFRQHGADAILFSSSSTVESFAAQAAALQLAEGARRPLTGSIGPQTGESMKKAGIPGDFSAKTPSLDSLVQALVKKLKS
ncbi:MAG: uroporphyrinogen-III C-methyltransferase [Opitutaceae bacterium]